MKITRLGHATLLVEHADARILIDPGVYSSPEAFELEGIDAVVVTHQHADHVDVERVGLLAERNPDAKFFCEAETQLTLNDERWTSARDGESFAVGSIDLTVVGGPHAVIHPEIPVVGNIGLIIRADNAPSVFHPGDSYAITPPNVDVLALPISAPWAKLSETIEFVRSVGAQAVFPIHDRALADVGYGIYWNSVARLGGSDAHRLSATDSLEL